MNKLRSRTIKVLIYLLGMETEYLPEYFTTPNIVYNIFNDGNITTITISDEMVIKRKLH